jgi:hypothetical protein
MMPVFAEDMDFQTIVKTSLAGFRTYIDDIRIALRELMVPVHHSKANACLSGSTPAREANNTVLQSA